MTNSFPFGNPPQTPFNTPYSPLNANDLFSENNPDYQKLKVLQADVDYFITVYGQQEALEITNIDNPASNTIKVKKLQYALEDAFALILSFYSNAARSGKALIMSSFRRTQVIMARYFLDSAGVRPRDHVVEAFNAAIQQLQLWSTGGAPNLLKFGETYQYYREQPYSNGVSLIRSSHEHKRKFTAASLEPWVEGWCSNDTHNVPLRWNEQRFQLRYNVGGPVGSLPDSNISPTGTVFNEDPDCIDQFQENYEIECEPPAAQNAEDSDCNDSVICDAPVNFTF